MEQQTFSFAAGSCGNRKRAGSCRRRAVCKVAGCTKPHLARGFCEMHYARSRNGIPLDKKVRRKTGWWVVHGYRTVRDEGRAKLEHRVVWERANGRKLTRGETIHHVNGDRQDNRSDNLELWFKGQPAGQRVADLIVYIGTFHRAAVLAYIAENP